MHIPQPSRASQEPANAHWLQANFCINQLLAGSPGRTNIMLGFSRDGRFTRFATHACEASGNAKSPEPGAAAWQALHSRARMISTSWLEELASAGGSSEIGATDSQAASLGEAEGGEQAMTAATQSPASPAKVRPFT